MRRLIAGSVPGHRAADETAKCPESLCPLLVLPSTERCVPSLPWTLLHGLCSYGLMRQSRLALLHFSLSLVRGVFAGCYQPTAATGIFPTLSLRIFPQMPGPMPRRSHRVQVPVTSSVSSAFPNKGVGRLPAFTRERDFSRSVLSELQTFLYVQASKFAHLPDRSYRCAYCAGQPRFLHPGISCFVASARTGYASRPNTGN